MKKTRILQIVPIMRSAGIENFIMNVYRNIDRDKIQFDFLVHSKYESDFDKEIESLGGKIYRLSFKDDKNIFKYIKDLNEFFKQHKEYQIIHGEMQSMMPLYLYIAKKNNVKIRIAHSHNSDYEKTLKGFILHVFSRLSFKYANCLWACSNTAGKYLFKNKEYTVIHNAIDQSKFSFDKKTRGMIREKLNLEDAFIIGHIGRFEKQKNHKFLIDVFKEVLIKEPKAVLLCFGCGKLEKDIKEYAKQSNVIDNIRFMGVVGNTYDYYQAMDAFVLPSLYEGLPLVGVEAQICGLPCFFSDTITDELKLTKNSYFLSLDKHPINWAESILQNSNIKRETNNIPDYDLINEANRIANLYIEMEEK